MSDQPPPMEGWNISSRLVLAGMVAILVVLAGGLLLSLHHYRATIEPATHARVHRFPAPSLDGFDDPAQPTPAQPPSRAPALSDAALAAAVSPLPFMGRSEARDSDRSRDRGNQRPYPASDSALLQDPPK